MGLFAIQKENTFVSNRELVVLGLQTDCCLLWKKTIGRNLNQEILTNMSVHEKGNVCSFLTNLKSFITIAKNKLKMGTVLPKGET